MMRRLASPWRCTVLSVLLMSVGISIDMLRSPTGSIEAVCSSPNSLIDNLRLHAAVMPAAHAAMLLAPFVVVAADFGWAARNPVAALARAGGLMLEMLVAEIVVLVLRLGALNAGFMMLAMAGVMAVFAGVKSALVAQ
jgi:hypothetical protein